MRRIPFILILFQFLCMSGYAQDEPFKKYDYGEIGLTFMVPAHWEHDGLTTTTKAAFIKQFGWTYTKPDANDVWSAFGGFSSITVDSTRLPSSSAYEIHKMTLFVSRAHTLYRRWLCLQRRVSILESRPLVQGGYEIIQRDKVRSRDLPRHLSDVNGFAYQYYSRETDLITQGHVYNFVHQEKCYEIRLESTTVNPIISSQLHQRIFNSVQRFSF